MADGHYERVGRTLVHKGVIIDYYTDRMSLPDGREEDWDLIDHKGAAAAAAVLEDGRVLMVRQYRNTLGRETLEIPAGGLQSREEPTADAAARELSEETGYTAGSMEKLLSFCSTIASCNEKIDIYVAKDLKPGKQHLDDDEFLNVEKIPLKDVIRMIYDGKIQDGKTIAAIMTYAGKYGAGI